MHYALKISNDFEDRKATEALIEEHYLTLLGSLILFCLGIGIALYLKTRTRTIRGVTGKYCKSVPCCCSDGLPGDTHFQVSLRTAKSLPALWPLLGLTDALSGFFLKMTTYGVQVPDF